MSQKTIKWLARGLSFAAIGVSIWWSGIMSDLSFKSFTLYAVFCTVGLLSLISGFMSGYRKCAINHDIKGDL